MSVKVSRILFGGLILLLLVGMAWMVIAQKRYPTAPEMRGHLAKGDCADCHRDIYKEWSESGHAQAWTSKLYTALRAKYNAPKDCDPCHAPQPLHITGIDKMPQARTDDPSSGVDCLACHLDGEGAMRGPNSERSPFHQIHPEPTLYTQEIRLCAACHGQKSAMAHNQVDAFKQSIAFKRSEFCQKCHMPEIERKPSRLSRTKKTGGEHSWAGSRSRGRLENTVLLDADESSKGIEVYINNTAAHPIPAAPLREIRLGILLRSSSGKVLYSSTQVFKHPLGVDSKPLSPPVKDIRLQAEEQRILTLPVKASAYRGANLLVSMMYRRAEGEHWVQMATFKRTF